MSELRCEHTVLAMRRPDKLEPGNVGRSALRNSGVVVTSARDPSQSSAGSVREKDNHITLPTIP